MLFALALLFFGFQYGLFWSARQRAHERQSMVPCVIGFVFLIADCAYAPVWPR